MRYPRPLIFINLPKAAGSTLQEIIARQYKWGRGFVFTGDPARYKQFIDLPEQERAAYDMLHGHVHFGIHQWLPEPATYATMLRDPIERIVSHYYFVRDSPTHYLHEQLHANEWTLDEYATQSANLELDNDQVRWLTEAAHDEVPVGHVSRAMLEEAKWNLEHAFAVFGLVERFDESLECLRAAFGWEDLACERIKNVNTDRPRTPLARRTRDAIRQANRWDVELYEFACQLFERQMVRLGVPPPPATSPASSPAQAIPAMRQAAAANGVTARTVVSARELAGMNGNTKGTSHTTSHTTSPGTSNGKATAR